MLVALDLQATLEELGFGPVDLASCMETAIQAAGTDRGSAPDLALVDVNLADGPTGPARTDAASRGAPGPRLIR